MALAYLNIIHSQQEIGRIVKIRKGFGTPAPNIVKLQSRQIDVLYGLGATLDELQHWLHARHPVIAFVQASELPHWANIRAQHAILVVQASEQTIDLHDPAMAHGPISVPVGDFLLAWDEMENRYAVITRRLP
jgi:hypothetical protein